MSRLIGVVPTARLFEGDDPYQDNYVFVNSYMRRLAEAGGTAAGALPVDGYFAPGALEKFDALLLCGGRKIWPYHIQAVEHAVCAGKPLLGVCLGMQSICAYFMVKEQARTCGFTGPAVELFERMKREKYFFTRPVSGHWVVPLTRTTVDAVKHPVHFAPQSRLSALLGRQETMGASMHNYRADHVPQGLQLAAWADDGCIEGVEGENILGVQFHPEVDTVHLALFQALATGTL